VAVFSTATFIPTACSTTSRPAGRGFACPAASRR
jgi:hypothetical protein